MVWEVKEFIRPRYYPVSPDMILEIGEKADTPLARALFFLIYLTGSRISEAVQFKPINLEITPDFYKVSLITLKKKKQRNMRRIIPIPRGEKAKCHEDKMMGYVIDFIRGMELDKYPFWKYKDTHDNGIYLRRHIDLLTEAQVKIGDIWYDKTLTKGLHPHYLRHARATHLVTYYNFNDSQLRIFFNWSHPETAAKYTTLADITKAF